MKNKHRRLLLCGFLPFLVISASLKAQQSPAGRPPETAVVADTASPLADSANVIYTETEIKASVDKKLWRRHLESRLGEPAINAMKDGIQPGRYVVTVRFIVEKDGSISAVTALTDPGYGLAKAAVKVVQSGPTWTAAEKNGQKVRSYHTQPITFIIGQTRLTSM